MLKLWDLDPILAYDIQISCVPKLWQNSWINIHCNGGKFFGDSEIYEYFSVEEYYYREQDISKKYKKYFQYLHNKIRVYTRNSFMAQLQFNCTIYYRINLWYPNCLFPDIIEQISTIVLEFTRDHTWPQPWTFMYSKAVVTPLLPH